MQVLCLSVQYRVRSVFFLKNKCSLKLIEDIFQVLLNFATALSTASYLVEPFMEYSSFDFHFTVANGIVQTGTIQ